jgi:hypothetical protein
VRPAEEFEEVDQGGLVCFPREWGHQWCVTDQQQGDKSMLHALRRIKRVLSICSGHRE